MLRRTEYIKAAKYAHMAQRVSSLIHPSWQTPPLSSVLWNLHHAGLISVYKSEIASTHFILGGFRKANRSAERRLRQKRSFFTRAVNTSTFKHQHSVILMSGLRGDSQAPFFDSSVITESDPLLNWFGACVKWMNLNGKLATATRPPKSSCSAPSD